jgi:phage terminase large subunit GpA-like protein
MNIWKQKMKKQTFNLSDEIRKYFDIQSFEHIIPWAEHNIDFSKDISAQRNRLDFDLYPYQKEVISQWEDLDHIKTVTVVAPEQMGKTNTYIVGLLWRMVFAPCQSMIVYPSDNLAAESNMTKIQPLMRRIPQLKAELDKPKSFRSDRYAFSNLISYFQGAGSKIVSKSCQVAIADEVDAWPVIGKVDNVADLKKRTRSYDSSITFLVCTPSE